MASDSAHPTSKSTLTKSTQIKSTHAKAAPTLHVADGYAFVCPDDVLDEVVEGLAGCEGTVLSETVCGGHAL